MKKIVLIDDHHITNKLHEIFILESLPDAEIFAFTDAQEGLHFITNHQVDIIFCDLRMPIMTGWEFVERYEHLYLSGRSTAPVYILSDSLSIRDHQKAEQYKSVECCVPKAFDASQLQQLLHLQASN